MKRLAVLAIILVGFSALCPAQRMSKTQELKIVQLPEPKQKGPFSLEQLMAKCKTEKQFTIQTLDFIQIGQLAWAGQSAIQPTKKTDSPIEMYFAIRDGTFAYDARQHYLKETFRLDIRNKLASALKQDSLANAPCHIIIACSLRKLPVKTAKHMSVITGQIAQNIRLQAASLGLASAAADDFNINQVSKICRLPAELEPICIICIGYPATQTDEKITQDKTEEKTEEKTQSQEIENTGVKKAVLIIASRNFRDEELFETKRQLEDANIETVIASTKTGIIKGTQGGKAEAAILINDISVLDYDAVIFVGGPGAKEYFDSSVALDITRQAKIKGKVIAAICIAPAVLANAGVLNGVKATSFSTEKYKLKKAGAEYTSADVERDGLIITANGPRAATEFGKTIADALTGQQ